MTENSEPDIDDQLANIDQSSKVVGEIDSLAHGAASVGNFFSKTFKALNPLAPLDAIHSGVSQAVQTVDKISKFLTGKEVINDAMDGERDEWFGGQSGLEVMFKPIIDPIRTLKRNNKIWGEEFTKVVHRWNEKHPKEYPSFATQRKMRRLADVAAKARKVSGSKGIKKVFYKIFG